MPRPFANEPSSTPETPASGSATSFAPKEGSGSASSAGGRDYGGSWALLPSSSADLGPGDSVLAAGARRGNLAEVLNALGDGADPNQVDYLGETPLFEAASHASIDVVTALLVYKADAKKRSKAGTTARDFASNKAVKLLLAMFQGVEVNSSTRDSVFDQIQPFLKRALLPELRSRGIVSVESKTFKAQEDHSTLPASNWPAAAPDKAEALLDVVRQAPLALAAEAGDLPGVMRLLQTRADPNEDDSMGETPLFGAAAGGNANLVVALILSAADPALRAHSGATARDFAATNASRDIIDLFAGMEVEPAARDAALGELSDMLRGEAQRALKKRGIATTARSTVVKGPPPPSGALLTAVQGGDLPEVRRLLARGADANEIDELGEPPLFDAVSRGEVDLVAALLLGAADPGMRSKYGDVLARDLTESDNVRLLIDLFEDAEVSHEDEKILLDGLVDLELREEIQFTSRALRTVQAETKAEEIAPLASAAQRNDLQAVLRLLDARADPNESDAVGETPIFEAVINCSAEVVATLLLRAADPLHRSLAGSCPRDMAADSATKALFGIFCGKELEAGALEALSDSLCEETRDAVCRHYVSRQAASRTRQRLNLH